VTQPGMVHSVHSLLASPSHLGFSRKLKLRNSQYALRNQQKLHFHHLFTTLPMFAVLIPKPTWDRCCLGRTNIHTSHSGTKFCLSIAARLPRHEN